VRFFSVDDSFQKGKEKERRESLAKLKQYDVNDERYGQ